MRCLGRANFRGYPLQSEYHRRTRGTGEWVLRGGGCHGKVSDRGRVSGRGSECQGRDGGRGVLASGGTSARRERVPREKK